MKSKKVKNESESPISKEMYYSGQVQLSERIKELKIAIETMSSEQKKLSEQMNTHIISDSEYQKEDLEFKETMKPMLKLFDDNNIVKMRLTHDFKTIIFYSAGFTTIATATAGFIYGIIYFSRHI